MSILFLSCFFLCATTPISALMPPSRNKMKCAKSKIWHICGRRWWKKADSMCLSWFICYVMMMIIMLYSGNEQNEIIVHFLIIFVAKMSDCLLWYTSVNVLFGVKCIYNSWFFFPFICHCCWMMVLFCNKYSFLLDCITKCVLEEKGSCVYNLKTLCVSAFQQNV